MARRCSEAVESVQVPVAGETLHVGIHPAATPRGTVLMVHGFLSDGREFADAPARLSGLGWTTAVLDLRGHGRSTGPRGYASARVASEDVGAALAALRARGLPEPFFLVGHSAGSALILDFLRHHGGVAAAALVAPLSRLLDQVDAPERALYVAAGSLNRAVMKVGLPSLKIPYKYATRSGYRKLFEDRAAADRAWREGFLQKKADLAWYDDMRAIDGPAWAKEVRTPALVVIATRDRIVRNAGSQEVFDALAGAKRLVKLDTCHSAFGDAKAGELIAAIDGWFGEHAKR